MVVKKLNKYKINVNFDIKKGLENWNIILHEVVGISYYKITDKI